MIQKGSVNSRLGAVCIGRRPQDSGNHGWVVTDGRKREREGEVR